MNNLFSLNYFCISYYIEKYKCYPKSFSTKENIFKFEIQRYNLDILNLQKNIDLLQKKNIKQLFYIEDINKHYIELKQNEINISKLHKMIIYKQEFKKYFLIILNKIFNFDKNLIINSNDSFYFLNDRIDNILLLFGNDKIKYYFIEQYGNSKYYHIRIQLL